MKLRVAAQHTLRGGFPGHNAAVHLKSRKRQRGIRTVNAHIIQLQTSGLEGQIVAWRQVRQIHNAVAQFDAAEIQRVAELQQGEAEINAFCHDRGRLAVMAEAEVVENDVRRRGEIMLDLAEGEMPCGFIAHVTTEPARAPLRLQQNVDHHQA